MKKNILFLGTGGTIAGQSKGKTQYIAGVKSIELIIENLNIDTKNVNIFSKQLCNIDSVEMDFNIWFMMYFEIFQAMKYGIIIDKNSKICSDVESENIYPMLFDLNKPSADITKSSVLKKLNYEFKNIDSIIVTHGSDTLEESAFFIYLLLQSKAIEFQKKVIFTGSMRPIGSSSDALSNLNLALKLGLDSRIYGVLVAFDNKIFSPKDIVKTNMNDFNAFSAINGGLLGVLANDEIRFFTDNVTNCNEYLRSLGNDFANTFLLVRTSGMDIESFLDSMLPKVHILYAYSGDNMGEIAMYLANSGASGLVIAGCGAGNINRKNKEILERVMRGDFLESKKAQISQNCVIIALSSRVTSGIIPLNPLNYLESNRTKNTAKNSSKTSANFISTIALNPVKSRILLTLLLFAKNQNLNDNIKSLCAKIQDHFLNI